MGKADGSGTRRASWATHAACFAAGAVVATALAAHAVPGPSPGGSRDRYRTLDSFAQALAYIQNSYVDRIDERKLIYGGIRGMMKELDPHSSFYTPGRYRQLRQDTEGEFAGVGIRLDDGQGGPGDHPVIEAIVPASPAARAGLEVGDRVLEIDGKSTATKRVSARAWHSRLRGPSGTRVELVVDRRGWREPATRALVREHIKVPTVASTSFGRVGYVSIRKFQEATSADVAAALRDLTRSAGGELAGLILDLRGNPGGLLDQGIRVADLFIGDGVLVTVKSRRGSVTEVERARAEGTWAGFPMLVLIDEGSASAAEIVAGALQDHGRARVVGVRSYGKGSVQTFLDLEDGSGLKLTTSRYYTPKGRSLEGVGIEPDVVVEDGEVIVAGGARASRETLHEVSAAARARLEEDRQLRVAYETLVADLRDPGRRRTARR